MTVKDSKVKLISGTFGFERNRMWISGSLCQMALSIENSDTAAKFIRLIDLTISNSHNDIFSVNISRENIALMGNTSFLGNQGSTLILNGENSFGEFYFLVTLHTNTKVYFELVTQLKYSLE